MNTAFKPALKNVSELKEILYLKTSYVGDSLVIKNDNTGKAQN